MLSEQSRQIRQASHPDVYENADVESFACDDSFSHTVNTCMRTGASNDKTQGRNTFNQRHHQPFLNNNSNNNTNNNEDSDDDMIEIAKSTNIMAVKWSVVLMLVLSGTAIATMSYTYTTAQEYKRFSDEFESDSTRFLDVFVQRNTNQLWALFSLSVAYKSLIALSETDTTNGSNSNNSTTPNVTLPNFETQTLGDLQTSGAASLFFAPSIVTAEQQAEWEQYATEHAAYAGISENIFIRPIEAGIYRLGQTNFDRMDDTSIPNSTTNRKLPIWQINPSGEKRHLIMLNLDSIMPNAFNFSNATTETPLFGNILDEYTANYVRDGGNNSSLENSSTPRSFTVLPILNAAADGGDNDIVLGITGAEIEWITLFDNVVPDAPTVCIVLENTCGQVHTYLVKEGIASHLGSGDQHDVSFQQMAKTVSVVKALEQLRQQIMTHTAAAATNPDDSSSLSTNFEETTNGEQGFCIYSITVYPTTEYEQSFHTGLAFTYTLTTIVLSVTSIFLFVLYSILVDRRQKRVLDSAAKSNAIIKSLFPAVVRRRLFGQAMAYKRANDSNNNDLLPSPNNALISIPLRRRRGRRLSLTQQRHANNPKTRLTNFLTSTSPNDVYAMEHQDDDEPIAEMFSNTTVMFADIAGFTAWSSEREPSQVFKLLETLYHEFDNVATRLGVFKVETIGDCYVAVSGLPTPNKDHAKTMVRFAHKILTIANQLTEQLEAVLGPGTSDLGLRVGLHSGPVTAGVLRGAKSRFQLFGDTMNTASRIESAGEAGKIQVSETTAELIREAGKQHWLTKRDGTITAKGKGELQTYWAMLRRPKTESATPLIQESENIADENLWKVDYLRQQPHSPLPQRTWGNVPSDAESVMSRLSLNVKEERLIDWNVAVLMSFLEKVVQHRLMAPENNRSVRFGKHASDNFKTRQSFEGVGSGLIIDEVVEVISLPKFNSSLSSTRGRAAVLPKEVQMQMKEFVASIASLYRQVPFHNFEHASHVTMSANKLMKRIILPEDNSNESGMTASDLHFSTFGISSDPLTQFAVVFSALIHDVDHTGLSNSQLTKERAGIARIFNYKSIAEQNSVVVAWELLMDPRFADLQTCIFASESDRKRFRQLVVNVVMATDIMDPDMVSLRKKRWEKAFDPSLSNEAFLLDVDVNRKATIVIEHIIQASDVAHTMQHWHIFIKWNTKLYRELYRAYIDGHSDKDPSEGWYQDQLVFFDKYVIPLANKLGECGVFGVSGDEYLTYAKLNRAEWEQKGIEETRKMIRKVQGTMRSSEKSLRSVALIPGVVGSLTVTPLPSNDLSAGCQEFSKKSRRSSKRRSSRNGKSIKVKTPSSTPALTPTP